MNISKELAEILGMFAADGCLQKGYVCMWGNIHEDKDYYDNTVCPFYSRVFNKKIAAHEKKSNSVYGFYLCDKNVVEFFKSLGFTNNKTYDVKIPKEIMESEDDELIAAFIRGFVDCDGSFSLMKRKGKYKPFKLKFNTYPRIEMSSVSKVIILQISLLLNKLSLRHTVNVHRSKIPNIMPSYKIMIRGPDRIEDFMKKVGFHNPAQCTRYLVWKKFGFSPRKSTIEQRKLFLEGKLNPYDSYKK